MNTKKGLVDKSTRLRFADDERADPELAPYIRKVEKTANKLGKAKSRLPKKTVILKEHVFDEVKARPKTRLFFEEISKPMPHTKMRHAVMALPAHELFMQTHRGLSHSEQENVGVEAAHRSEMAVETGARTVCSIHRSHQLQTHRSAARLERKTDQANINALYKNLLSDKPQLSSNPLSRWQQKRAIKRQYAAVKGAKRTKQVVMNTKNAVKRTAEATKKTVAFLVRNWKPILIVIGIAIALLLIINAVSSFLMLFQSSIPSVVISTYPSTDEAMLGAEATYAAMEAELQEGIDNYETMHSGYDEYRYDLDEIAHDPYVLVSILTAWYDGEWTLDEVQGTFAMLFEKQYQLTETVEKEIRYRTETRKGTRSYTDPDTGETVTEEYAYDVEVPYNYTVCNITLHNENLSHLPIYIMSEEKVGMYAIFMSTLGNRPDLFAGCPTASTLKTFPEYDIPEEYLTDETFAAIIEEAEKYLGYPYVWGGGNPTTSFDCSGFVTWVLTNSGVMETGRRSAQGLYNICTPVSAGNAKPGDLVFFAGTYDSPGISHVGIYVGDGMMIHAGNPIHYASINTPYYHEHLYAFGRPDY